jgi:zinc and cadmium transporter
MNLFGDGMHNFVDGMVIAGSYMVSIPLGMTTTLAVIAHEGAQELGDFAVLIKGGLTRRKALWFNFLSAVAAILGGLITIFISTQIENLASFLLPFTFAGFLYIALGTLIPELHQETLPRQLLAQAVGILMGIGLMALLAGL